MFNQFEDMLLGALIQKLNTHGLNVNEATIKEAVANSPQLVAKIESILLTSNSQDKITQITALINQATKGDAPAAPVNQPNPTDPPK